MLIETWNYFKNNMTYRDLKNFCKIMRWIDNSRPISVENSKLPYFRLVAALCLWFSKRLDQSWEFIDNINEVRKLPEIFYFLKQNFVFMKVNIQRLNIFINLLMNWALGYNCLSGGVSPIQNQCTGSSKPKGEPLCLFCYYNYSFKIYLSLESGINMIKWCLISIVSY